jgi:hypothetical protein
MPKVQLYPEAATEPSTPTTTALKPHVAEALAHLERDKQAARDSGLWSPAYERMTNALGEMFVEQNDVDSVLEAAFQGMANHIAAEHNLRMVRANESADEQMGGEIVVWRNSGLVILPHSMTAIDALDQLRAALDEKADA